MNLKALMFAWLLILKLYKIIHITPRKIPSLIFRSDWLFFRSKTSFACKIIWMWKLKGNLSTVLLVSWFCLLQMESALFVTRLWILAGRSSIQERICIIHQESANNDFWKSGRLFTKIRPEWCGHKNIHTHTHTLALGPYIAEGILQMFNSVPGKLTSNRAVLIFVKYK